MLIASCITFMTAYFKVNFIQFNFEKVNNERQKSHIKTS